MPERKTLNEDLFHRGSSANLPRLHTCENKVPFWDFSQFAVTVANDLGFGEALNRSCEPFVDPRETPPRQPGGERILLIVKGPM